MNPTYRARRMIRPLVLALMLAGAPAILKCKPFVW